MLSSEKESRKEGGYGLNKKKLLFVLDIIGGIALVTRALVEYCRQGQVKIKDAAVHYENEEMEDIS